MARWARRRSAGEKTGRNPTDRGKLGSKRSLLTDGRGMPLSVAVGGANRNDHKLMRETLESLAAKRPAPTDKAPQHLCLDKGYDYQEPRDLAVEFAFTLHLRTRGEEAEAKRHAGAKTRRWVVERAHSWMNRFRRILIRWEKKPANYPAMLHFALGLITWRNAILPRSALSLIEGNRGHPNALSAIESRSARRATLRAEVQAVALAELARAGTQWGDRTAVVRRFEGRGASRATLFQYIDAALQTGVAGAPRGTA